MDKIKIRIDIEQESLDIEGNASAYGDERDKEIADEIRKRLAKGDDWAWCWIRVTASYAGFKGDDTLGGCSYLNEKDFKEGGYYEDMKDNALADLKVNMQAAVLQGHAAGDALKVVGKAEIAEES